MSDVTGGGNVEVLVNVRAAGIEQARAALDRDDVCTGGLGGRTHELTGRISGGLGDIIYAARTFPRLSRHAACVWLRICRTDHAVHRLLAPLGRIDPHDPFASPLPDFYGARHGSALWIWE